MSRAWFELKDTAQARSIWICLVLQEYVFTEFPCVLLELRLQKDWGNF
jgi:hypothetical protein